MSMKAQWTYIALVCLIITSSLLAYRMYIMEREMKMLREEIYKAKEDVSFLRSRISLVEERIVTINASISRALRRIDDIEAKMDIAYAELDFLMNTTNTLSEALSDVVMSLDILTSEVNYTIGLVSNMSIIIQGLIDHINELKADTNVIASWLKEVSSELNVIADILYGRTYITPKVIEMEPSKLVKEFTNENVGYQDLISDLKALSIAVYKAVRYSEDPTISPVIIEVKRIYCKSYGVSIPRYELKIIRTEDVQRTPTETLKLKKGDCDDYSILFMVAADYYLDNIKRQHAVVQLVYVGRTLTGKWYCHAISIGVIIRDQEVLWFLADPTWRGYFTYSVGNKDESYEVMLSCILNYMLQNSITAFVPQRVLTYDHISYPTSYKELHDVILGLVK